jgi:uncharacterized protein (TIGR03067 family)
MTGTALSPPRRAARPRLAVAITAVGVALAACKGNADFSGAVPDPVVLDADRFRGEITEIDRLVFGAAPLEAERRAALASRLDELAGRVKATSDSRFLALEALELRALGQAAKSRPQAALCNDWMRIRNNLFEDRSWFARSAADLEPLPGVSKGGENPVGAEESAAISRPGAASANEDGLDGRWRVRDIEGNGRPISDPELTNSVWAFSGDELAVQGPAGPRGLYRVTRIRDGRGSALYLESKGGPGSPAAARTERGWMLYELAGAELKLAFFDGLSDRPESFERPSGRGEPMFLVVSLNREP